MFKRERAAVRRKCLGKTLDLTPALRATPLLKGEGSGERAF